MAKVTIGGRDYDVEVRGMTVIVDGHEFEIEKREERGATIVTAGGIPYRIEGSPAPPANGTEAEVTVDYRPVTLKVEGTLGGARPATQRAERKASAATASGGIVAPMAGTIVRVDVKAGDTVSAGDVLLVMEAMKMENEIKAPKDGTVDEVLVSAGQKVSEGTSLVALS
jgi:biotin carboxyl carrier protein